MRFEATLSEVRGKTLLAAAEELGMSRSQLIDEALALWLEVMEARRQGGRLVVEDPTGARPDRELVTPSMAHLDWKHHREQLALTPEQFQHLLDALRDPQPPTDTLQRLMAGEDVEGAAFLETQGIGG